MWNVILYIYPGWGTTCFQMFTSVRVVRLSNVNLTNQGLNKIFTDLCENLLKVHKGNVMSYSHCILCSYILNQVVYLWLLQSFYFKLRSMIPCCLCHLNFTVAVPEEELIQVRKAMIYKTNGCGLICKTCSHWLFFTVMQVAVTAVAMTFDKNQTQEKPADKTVAKGLSVRLWISTCSTTCQISQSNHCLSFVDGFISTTVWNNRLFIGRTLKIHEYNPK